MRPILFRVLPGGSRPSLSLAISRRVGIALVGTIQTRTWDDQDGRRHYVTEVVTDEINFVDYRVRARLNPNTVAYQLTTSETATYASPPKQTSQPMELDGFLTADDDATELPFDI